MNPLKGFWSREGGGRVNIAGAVRGSKGDMPEDVRIPCGKCIGCRLDKARDWATRCVHEASMHSVSCFTTFTYDDDHLPPDYSVSVRELQLLMKRLRKSYGVMRFFGVGEYGPSTRRPHYHVLLFGFRPDDGLLLKTGRNGDPVYASAQLSKVWPFGFTSFGEVTHQSAGYVARYALKKFTGPDAPAVYRLCHPITGAAVEQAPEFARMSLRPGIGYEWLKRFECDVYPSKFVVVDGRKRPVPQAYKRRLAEEKRGAWLDKLAEEFPETSPDGERRLADREEVLKLRAARLGREEL